MAKTLPSTPTEAYIVALGEKNGKRWAERLPLHVPVDLARGWYEGLSELQIREAINDLLAEQMRREERDQHRAEIAERTGGWNPFDALRT